jgi:hypothetical protein
MLTHPVTKAADLMYSLLSTPAHSENILWVSQNIHTSVMSLLTVI